MLSLEEINQRLSNLGLPELNKVVGRFKPKSKVLNHYVSKYGLDGKRVLDLGCGFGEYLVHFGSGSVGVDGNEVHCKVVRALGFDCVQANLEEDWSVEGKFDAIWCSNILEHMVAPFLFLYRLRKFLKDDGVLIVTCPVMTFSLFEFVRVFKNFDAHDHVNFYSRRTLAHSVKRSGYSVVESNAGIPSNRFLNVILNPFFKFFSPQISVVARVNFDFQISKKDLFENLPFWSRKYI